MTQPVQHQDWPDVAATLAAEQQPSPWPDPRNASPEQVATTVLHRLHRDLSSLIDAGVPPFVVAEGLHVALDRLAGV